MRLRDTFLIVSIGASSLITAAPAAAQPGPALAPGVQRIDPGAAPGRDGVLAPVVMPTMDTELIGLHAQATLELLTWDRAYALALVRARSGSTTVAETLDPQALAEQARRHGVADFPRFRKDFLAGRAEAGGAFRDPSGAYLAILRRLQTIEDARRHVATLENLSRFMREMVQGSGAGLSQLDIDLVAEALARGRQRIFRELAGFRDGLDELKVELGLSPHAAVVPDRGALVGFPRVLDAVEAWSRRSDRMLAEVPRIVGRLPVPGDAVVDGRAILGAIEEAPIRMEHILRESSRLAIRNRAGADPAKGESEVVLELRIRRRIRHLLDTRRAYEDQKRSYVRAIVVKDQSFERLFSPPSGAGASPRTPVVRGLLDDLERVRDSGDRLIVLWTSFRAERLALYRDLGALPYDNWGAFYADLMAEPAAAGQAPADAPARAPGSGIGDRRPGGVELRPPAPPAPTAAPPARDERPRP